MSQGDGTCSSAVSERWLEAYPQTLWRRHSDAVHAALLERWLPARLESVLKTDLFDEAVSGGLYPTLARRAKRVVGIDASAAIVEAARARHPALVAVRADVRRLPFGDAEFEAIVSNSTLDHFDSRAEIVAGLREVRRLLRPGGTLVLTLDNPANPILALSKVLPRGALNRGWVRFGRATSSVGLLPYYVGETLGVGRTRRLLAELDLAVVESGAIVHAPRVLAVLVANVLQQRASPAARERFLRIMMAFEQLSRWPTRYVTGHFVAVRAIRPFDSV